MTLPDVLSLSDSQLNQWQEKARSELEPVLARFRRAGIQIQAALNLMMSSGCIGRCRDRR
jgi:hypothetical protein